MLMLMLMLVISVGDKTAFVSRLELQLRLVIPIPGCVSCFRTGIGARGAGSMTEILLSHYSSTV